MTGVWVAAGIAGCVLAGFGAAWVRRAFGGLEAAVDSLSADLVDAERLARADHAVVTRLIGDLSEMVGGDVARALMDVHEEVGLARGYAQAARDAKDADSGD